MEFYRLIDQKQMKFFTFFLLFSQCEALGLFCNLSVGGVAGGDISIQTADLLRYFMYVGAGLR